MEAMAVESLVASVWRLEGFLPVLRYPLRVERGYTDIDVVGVRGGGVRIAECKVRGPAQQVTIESASQQWSERYVESTVNIDRLWKHRPEWLPPIKDVGHLEFHVVGNVWFSDRAARDAAEKKLTHLVRENVPAGLVRKTKAHIYPTIDLVTAALSRIRTEVVEQRWGRRYGDPFLDALREVVRFANPKPRGARGMRSAIQSYTRSALLNAAFGEDGEPGNDA